MLIGISYGSNCIQKNSIPIANTIPKNKNTFFIYSEVYFFSRIRISPQKNEILAITRRNTPNENEKYILLTIS